MIEEETIALGNHSLKYKVYLDKIISLSCILFRQNYYIHRMLQKITCLVQMESNKMIVRRQPLVSYILLLLQVVPMNFKFN